MGTWQRVIQKEIKKEYFKKLAIEVERRYKTTTVFPEKKDIFRAFALTKPEDVKVVILGQDPYHRIGQAQGLAFSTPKNIKNPPSMKNILKEINDDLGRPSSCNDGNLIPWARQGVLLLNTILTVDEGKAKSHEDLGWEIFTDNIIKVINEHLKGVIFILWGNEAILKEKLIDKNRHFVLTAPHPSPFSAYRGFYGCKHFSKTNNLLKALRKKEINW